MSWLRNSSVTLAAVLFCLSLLPLFSQDQSEMDGPQHVFQDALLDNLKGTWKLSGKVMGRVADHTVETG